MTETTEFKSESDYARKVLGMDLADSVDNLTDSIASDLNRLSFGFDDDRPKYRSYQSLNSLLFDKKRRPDSMPVFGLDDNSKSEADLRPASAKTTQEQSRTLSRQATRHNAQRNTSSSSSDERPEKSERPRPKKKPKLRTKNFTRLLSQIKQFGSKDEKEDSN